MNDAYLWDRSGDPDPDIRRLEDLLGRLRWIPRAPEWPARVVPARPRLRRTAWFLAAAATLALAVGAGWFYRSTSGPAWAVTRVAGAPRVGSRSLSEAGRLAVGEWVETDHASRASLDVENIGRVEIDPNTRLRLIATQTGNHRLALARGRMHAYIWAPPGQFFVETPSAVAVDLGCIYTLEVDDAGAGLVRVVAGWVGFEWRGRESFIPAGAIGITRPGVGPGTPYFEDVSHGFREALGAIDFGRPGPEEYRASLQVVLDEARSQDAVTLWHLLTRVSEGERDLVYDRLASFIPPPSGVTLEGIRSGDRRMLDLWWESLGFGSADWWRTWKQAWPPKR